MNNALEKFEFNIGFQWDIIKYTLTEPKGYRALLFYKAAYFDLIDQQVIVRAIERFYKRRSRVPSKASILIEELKYIFKSKDFVNTLKDKDRKKIIRRVKSLYKRGIKDGDEILENIANFASYIEVKDIVSKFDVTNYTEYTSAVTKLQNAVNKKRELETHKGSFLISGVRSRVARRRFADTLLPTPFWQLNKTTNAGGYTKGSVIVLLDKEKGGKTLSLVNIARGYLSKMRKRVVIFDFENGQEAYEDRLDQSILRVTKKELLSKDQSMDQKLKKMYRKYKRLGADLYIERLPAGSTFNDIETSCMRLKDDFGFIPEVLLADYFILMDPIQKKGSDHEDVSQVYIDAKTFGEKWDLDCIWTANHVSKPAYKRRVTRYISGDAAKALDIGRHADVIIGINQTKLEIDKNIMRWEIVDQRDGRRGPIFFDINYYTQYMKEFTRDYVKTYRDNGYEIDKEPNPRDDHQEISDI